LHFETSPLLSPTTLVENFTNPSPGLREELSLFLSDRRQYGFYFTF